MTNKTAAPSRASSSAKSSGTDAPGDGSASDADYVPVTVRAEVYDRDGGACTYVDPESGQRCGEQRWLQLDHIVPRCRGGAPTPGNLRLMCGCRNRLMARELLGDAFMDRKLAESAARDREQPR